MKRKDPLHTRSFAPLAARRLNAPAPLRFWHLASLDAPAVAVVWALGFAWAAEVRLAVWVLIVMALTVWVVYLADRLLDAFGSLRASQAGDLRDRHWFHWRHRRILIPLAVAAALAAACIVAVSMPAPVCEPDAILAVAALAYFARVHAGAAFQSRTRASTPPVMSKEFLVGILFTAGCVLPAWIGSRPTQAAALAAAFFAVLAWLNCHAIERWEAQPAKAREGRIARAALTLAFAGITLAAAAAAWQTRVSVLLLAGTASALLLALLDRSRHRLTPLALRVSADLALLTPLGVLWRSWVCRQGSFSG